eukprot:220551-Hanusia_phi.AAC.1
MHSQRLLVKFGDHVLHAQISSSPQNPLLNVSASVSKSFAQLTLSFTIYPTRFNTHLPFPSSSP